MVRWMSLPLALSTLFTQEITTIVRYVVNDFWVFHETRLSWTRLWQFHVASIGGAIVWLTLANALPKLGMNYLLASTIGTVSSMLVTMATNFLWIWGKRTSASSSGPDTERTAVQTADA